MQTLPRKIQPQLETAMAESPVVLLQGARETGKTHLVKGLCEKYGNPYISLESGRKFEMACADPVGFAADLPPRIALDGFHRVPELFDLIRAMAAKSEEPGRVLLSGSSEILQSPGVQELPEGLLQSFQLYPVSKIESLGGTPKFLDRLYNLDFEGIASRRLGNELLDNLFQGGFPTVLSKDSKKPPKPWMDSYLESLSQQDIKGLANIRAKDRIPELLKHTALQTARIFNASELTRPFKLSRPTIRDYVTLLEQLFVVERIPAWYNEPLAKFAETASKMPGSEGLAAKLMNRLNRVMKTAKLYMADTGFALAATGLKSKQLKDNPELYGKMVDNFIYTELRAQASWSPEPYEFSHYVDKDKYSVDVVIEKDKNHQTCGVEVTPNSTIRETMLRGLKRLKDACGKTFHCGVLLYDGPDVKSFGDKLFAVPLAAVWEEG